VKDPRRRLRDIGDARIELDEALNADRSSGQTAVRVVPVDRRWRMVAIVMAIMVPAAAAVALWIARPVAPSFEQLTFRRTRIGGARFASNGAAVIYSEATQGDALEIWASISPTVPWGVRSTTGYGATCWPCDRASWRCHSIDAS